MILDDENILRKRIKKIVNNPFLMLKQFLIENKTDKDFIYYDLKYALELNLILNKIPIEKYGYNWRILVNRIYIERYITLPSGIKYTNTITTINIDESDRLKIYIGKHHKYDEIVKLLKQYMPGYYETVYDENNISVILI